MKKRIISQPDSNFTQKNIMYLKQDRLKLALNVIGGVGMFLSILRPIRGVFLSIIPLILLMSYWSLATCENEKIGVKIFSIIIFAVNLIFIICLVLLDFGTTIIQNGSDYMLKVNEDLAIMGGKLLDYKYVVYLLTLSYIFDIVVDTGHTIMENNNSGSQSAPTFFDKVMTNH